MKGEKKGQIGKSGNPNLQGEATCVRQDDVKVQETPRYGERIKENEERKHQMEKKSRKRGPGV